MTKPSSIKTIKNINEGSIIITVFKYIAIIIPILVVFGSMIAWANSRGSKIDQLDSDLFQAKSNIVELQHSNANQDKDIVEIKTDLKYIIKILEKK